MTKMHENAKEIAVPKPKMMTFREFVEFRKQFRDEAGLIGMVDSEKNVTYFLSRMYAKSLLNVPLRK